jgi:hypothetical protein
VLRIPPTTRQTVPSRSKSRPFTFDCLLPIKIAIENTETPIRILIDRRIHDPAFDLLNRNYHQLEEDGQSNIATIFFCLVFGTVLFGLHILRSAWRCYRSFRQIRFKTMYLSEYSIDSLLDDQLAKLLTHPIAVYPSPHIFVPDAVNPTLLEQLWKSVPTNEAFQQINGGGRVARLSVVHDRLWLQYDLIMKLILLRLMSRFQPYIVEKKEELVELGMRVDDLQFYESFISYTDRERGIPPHVDGASSILSVITILGYSDGGAAPTTDFFVQVDSGAHKNVTNYPASRGGVLVWLNLKYAIHGLDESLVSDRLTHMASLECKIDC